MIAYLLTWSSGHKPPVPVYYYRTEEGFFNATYKRQEAQRFPTEQAARDAWMAMHAFPEDYAQCIARGTARVEREDESSLCL